MMMMIRKLMASVLVATSMLLANCSTTPTTVGGVTTTDPTLANDIAAVKAAVLTGCGYVVDLQTVASIVGTFVPGAALVGTVAQQICAAVLASGARQGVAAVPSVNGIVIHGYFANGARHRVHRLE